MWHFLLKIVSHFFWISFGIILTTALFIFYILQTTIDFVLKSFKFNMIMQWYPWFCGFFKLKKYLFVILLYLQMHLKNDYWNAGIILSKIIGGCLKTPDPNSLKIYWLWQSFSTDGSVHVWLYGWTRYTIGANPFWICTKCR